MNEFSVSKEKLANAYVNLLKRQGVDKEKARNYFCVVMYYCQTDEQCEDVIDFINNNKNIKYDDVLMFALTLTEN